VLSVGALVVLLICSGELAREQCTESTARVAVSVRLEQTVCGVGIIAAPARMDMGDGEFMRIICKMR
jgi:hypothetical protein